LSTNQFHALTPAAAPASIEPHYKPEELGKLWGLSANCIRSLFENEPGVLKIVRPEKLHKRRYISLRIPASVAGRVHARLDARRAA
jgi:hypothetical protein